MSSNVPSNLPTLLVGYLKRSVKHISLVFKESLNSLDKEIPTEKNLFPQFNLNDWIHGSDKDIGGESYSKLVIKDGNLLFTGHISTTIPKESQIQKSGYVGLRSKELPLVLLHTPRHNVQLFRYLELTVKGDKRLWNVNVQTESLYPSTLWQHRLYFSTPGEWETIRIPWRDFVKTDHGFDVLLTLGNLNFPHNRFVQKSQLPMDKTKIKTIGFSLIRQDGDFELEIKSMKATNTLHTFGDYDVLLPGQTVENGIIKDMS